jgi:hypothetical protein
MGLQETMFTVVEQWMASGQSKADFLKEQDFGSAKFNYWLAKWKTTQGLSEKEGFEPLELSGLGARKVLEIVTPGGTRITVFE